MTRRLTAAASIAAALVAGQVTDRTTGQPLPGVTVRAAGPAAASATTASDGRFHFTLRPGRYTVTVSSHDVPPQRFTITLGREKKRALDLVACSTTLDYSCADAIPSGGGGGG